MILVLVLVNPQKVDESCIFSLRFTPRLRSNRTPISHPWPCCTVLANCWKLFKATSNWRRDLNCWAMNLGGPSVGRHFGNVNVDVCKNYLPKMSQKKTKKIPPTHPTPDLVTSSSALWNDGIFQLHDALRMISAFNMQVTQVGRCASSKDQRTPR